MPNQSLVDLTERTATTDTDLIHVNSGGSDYKQTKANFLADYVSEIEFNNTSALTTQVDALPVGSYGGAYTGKIASYGHQSETGVPENDNYTVEVSAFSTQNKRITIMSVLGDKTYTRTKLNGTWGSWILVPRRDEITSLNNSLANSLALKITSSAPNLSNTSYPANSVKVMSITAPTDISQLINATIIGDYPSGSRQNLIAVSSWLYNGNVYVAIQNITSSSITATLQVQVWYTKNS